MAGFKVSARLPERAGSRGRRHRFKDSTPKLKPGSAGWRAMTVDRRAAILAVLALLGPGLSGCVGGPGGTDGPEPAAAGPGGDCRHPHPCEDPDAWPANRTGPFEVGDPELVGVESFHGTRIELAIWRPETPAGLEVPVVLHAQPYAGQCYLAPPNCLPMPDDPSWLEGYGGTPEALVENGYAFANMNVRGTGNSGGCFDLNGEDEARDIGHVVDHLANASWSNGRVGMYGLSYMGTTPWLGALQDTDALKTIVPGGIVVDEYLFGWTPQGAATVLSSGFNVPYIAGLGLYPPIGGGPQDATVDHVDNLPERACPDVVEAMAEYPSSQFTDDRDRAYFEERRSLTRLHEIDAAVLVAQGLEDQSGHGYQEDYVWPRLENAPKAMVLGQWGHQFPDGGMLDGHPVAGDWETMLLDWMDYWLKGTAPEPALGQVTYQTSDGAWHASERWPPAEAHRQVLHLAGERLAAEPGDASATFQVAPAPAGSTACAAGEPVGPGMPPSPHVYASEPAEAPVAIAGNPAA